MRIQEGRKPSRREITSCRQIGEELLKQEFWEQVFAWRLEIFSTDQSTPHIAAWS
jgi:hypothetical protein